MSEAQTRQPVEVDHVLDFGGLWHQLWMVTPPAVGEGFLVTKQEWDEELRVRTIYEWARPGGDGGDRG